MSKKSRSAVTVLALAMIAGAGPLAAQSFSIDAPSPGIAPPVPDDILAPGPPVIAPPPPGSIPFPGPILVAGAGMGFEVDALSYDLHPVFTPDGANFSVDPASGGAAATAVAAEAATGDHPADLFHSPFGGTNTLTHDGNGSAVGPLPLGLPEPAAANLDAADMTVPPPAAGTVMVYFSVSAATAAGPPYPGLSGADIFFEPNVAGYTFPGGMPPAPALAAAGIGLMAADEINALFYMEDMMPGPTAGDVIYFSLAPGSPSLGAIPAGAADILVTSPGGAPAIAFAAAAIGLLPGDNLDALDMHAPGEGFPVELQSFAIE